MLFVRFDWFLCLGISSTIHLLAVSGEKMACEPHFVVKYSSYLGTAIKLVLCILKELFASVSVTSGGYLPRRSGSVNIHRYSRPLWRIIVNRLLRAGCGYGSESEGEEPMDNQVELPQEMPGRGNVRSQQSAVRLTEVYDHTLRCCPNTGWPLGHTWTREGIHVWPKSKYKVSHGWRITKFELSL